MADLIKYQLQNVEGLEELKERGRGCYGAVFELTVNGVPCIGKRLHSILVGRVKEVHISYEERRSIIAKFKNECDVLASLRHPNIVQFMGVHFGKNGSEDVTLIMESLHMDLEKCINTYRSGAFPLPYKLQILRDIAYGLSYLHSCSVIHRDLNQGNVLLTESLTAKIADLGASKVVEYSSGRLGLSTLPGAIAYMPPEAMQSPAIYNDKLDCFSFGHLSLYLLNGKFPNLVDADIKYQDVQQKGIQRAKRRSSIVALGNSHVMYDVVIQCLADEPLRRPTSRELATIMTNVCSLIPLQHKNILDLNEERSKAEMVIALLKDKYDYMKYYIDAAKNYDDFEQARSFLNQPCPICAETYLMDDMVVLPACGCAFCKDCFTLHFTIVIKEQSVKDFNCPMCGKPDLSNETQDMNIELFVAMVKEFCGNELYELCQKKLTEFSLSKEPNFVWCINQECLSGFLTDRYDRIRVECPTCKKDMCFLCRKKWEHQHEGITCDQFTQWKIDNDPETQKRGLAAHLEENGIQCPGCKFRYDLARVGCMHFRCTQCPNKFCSGCGGTDKTGEECGKSEYCKTAGLHAHHPRDCLYYLRDFGVTELQELLTNNDVNFDIDPPMFQLELTCGVMSQKEGPEELYDEKCGKDCPDKMAGLCNDHYKEYLVDKINKTKLDPIELYTTMQLSLILKREDMPAFERDDETTDEDFRELLIEHIKQDIPLRR